ncbi:MAG: redoxin domain-containing protein [Acidobacteria bacterium]|nr:redoxin domain-containing protein [Acidobacteriota bacterium]
MAMIPARPLGWGLIMWLLVSQTGLVSGTEPRAEWAPREGLALLGARAPEWKGIEWIQGGPLDLEQLRGRTVLLRFWLVDCLFCASTAPALRELSERYGDRGLVVVGLHHPKSPAGRDPTHVLAGAKALGFDFAIGLDNDWHNIRAYGVGTEFRAFTSVSFLIDPEGVIRWVHDGGEFHRGGKERHRECNAAFASLEAKIEELLER